MCLRPERKLSAYIINYQLSQLRNTVKYKKAGKSQILIRPRLGLCINRDISRQRRKHTRNLKNQLKGLPRFTFSSIYIPCLLTLSYYIDYQANRRSELFLLCLVKFYMIFCGDCCAANFASFRFGKG